MAEPNTWIYEPSQPWTSPTVTEIEFLPWESPRSTLRLSPGELYPRSDTMKQLKIFQMIVVVRESREIILDRKLVADDRDEALIQANLSGVLQDRALDYQDVVISCKTLDTLEFELE